tara:strand:+ start:2733 stop:4409 length:1677 start_codon:yes stop_codon:yes gene_type:complete
MVMGYDSIKIPCRNGLEFGENNNQIVFDLGRDIGMANLKNAVIEIDVNINGSANAPCLQLNRVNGGQSLIQRIRVRSNGRLLEELDNYNLYSALHYSASQDNGILNKRTITEGCAHSYNIQDNPYVTQNEAAAAGAALNTAAQCWKYIDRKLQIPLLGGIFQSERSIPLMAIPLEIEIILAKGVHAMYSNPVLTDAIACQDVGAAQVTELTLTAAQCRKYGVSGTGNQYPTDSKLNMKANFPLRVGQRVQIANTGGAGVLVNGGAVNITSINDANGELVIGFGNNINNAAALTGVTISATNDGALFTTTAAAGGHAVVPQTVNYQVKNPRLIVPKIIPAPAFTKAMGAAIAKGQYAFDIVSYTDYPININGSTTKSTNTIPADLSRVKALLSVPTEQADVDKFNNVRALQGRYMGAESYEYQINNRMVPSRLVELSREAHGSFVLGQHNYINVPSYALGSCLAAVHTHEVEKALADSDIDVRNLTFLGKTAVNDDLTDGYYLVARTLGPYGMSENLMGISANLYLNYDGTNQNLKLLHNFAVHIRTIQLGPNGVVLRY